ncbi:MAG TPA: hypothetical protein VGO30_11600 [Mycobacterium sp.]|jgi:hypothetical protein|nr:hypothetical protein [Mycobacterium sp.]
MGRLATCAVLTVSAASTMLLLGSGVAQAGSAPTVVGQKYSDASSAISGAGFTAVVSTTVGDQKAWPDCVVSNQVQRTVPAPPNSSGSATNQILVSLNCDASEASATVPGYSAASPEGKAIAAAAASASAPSSSG